MLPFQLLRCNAGCLLHKVHILNQGSIISNNMSMRSFIREQCCRSLETQKFLHVLLIQEAITLPSEKGKIYNNNKLLSRLPGEKHISFHNDHGNVWSLPNVFITAKLLNYIMQTGQCVLRGEQNILKHINLFQEYIIFKGEHQKLDTVERVKCSSVNLLLCCFRKQFTQSSLC